MKKLYLYNTISRKKEEFKPISKDLVGLYTCGPTVYNFAHIGNLRTYIFEDILKRVLKYNGYNVKHVMNITDVGHLTGDMDMGEDKLEQGAKREGKTAWNVAEMYTKAFQEDLRKLNIIEPDEWTEATEFIKEQIEMINILDEKGYTYKTSDGIYFDTSKFDDYNKLSHLDLETLQEGARVEKNDEKRNPTDFALWKFSKEEEARQMEWWFEGEYKGEPLSDYNYHKNERRGYPRELDPSSVSTIGFPGWHLECSAMSKATLDGNLDIHCGGIDHINVHHTNEIAQSEAAYPDQKFFNFWMHGAFLNIAGGKKMAKSDDNFLTLENALISAGYNSLAYRYSALTTHYRKPMEWSDMAITGAQAGLNHLYAQMRKYYQIARDDKDGVINQEFKDKFLECINDDLNTSRALAVVQELLRSNLDARDKVATVIDFDKVLGLNLEVRMKAEIEDEAIELLVKERKAARKNKDWDKSDKLRDEIEKLGYVVEDGKDEIVVYKK